MTAEAGDTGPAVAVVSRRAKLAMGLVAATSVVATAEAVIFAGNLASWAPWSAWQGLDALATLAWVHIGASLAAAIAYAQWLHRAVALALGPLETRLFGWTPRSAVVSFFIPILNWWRPYRAVRALHEASDPARLPEVVEIVEDPRAGYRAPAAWTRASSWRDPRAPLRAWWAAWLLMALSSRGGFLGIDGLSFRSVDADVMFGGLAVALVHVAAGVLCIGVVRAVDARQVELGARLAADRLARGEEAARKKRRRSARAGATARP